MTAFISAPVRVMAFTATGRPPPGTSKGCDSSDVRLASASGSRSLARLRMAALSPDRLRTPLGKYVSRAMNDRESWSVSIIQQSMSSVLVSRTMPVLGS